MEVSNMSKSTFQKVYEKMTLIQQNPDTLCLVCIWDEGNPAIALGIKDGELVTPVAIMLDQTRIDNLDPDWNNYEVMQSIIAKAQELEDRTTMAEFDKQHAAIDKLFKDSDF
tara:strand:+ start:712 stop:1047 length:336 start_codon:yes stop_codon:yes gene_type:complete